MSAHVLARAPNCPQTGQSAREPADLVLAGATQAYCLLVRTHMEILSPHQAPREIERGVVETGGICAKLLASGEDQRDARLVDQHAVGLVDDRKMQPAQEQVMAAGLPAVEYPVDEQPGAGSGRPGRGAGRRGVGTQ